MTIPTKLNKKAETEYGRGLVTCLVKFAEHAEMWFKDKENWKQMHEKCPNLFSESDAVQKFFWGASDHLYGIEVPDKWRGTKIESRVNELRHFALHIRHGLTYEQWSEKDVIKAYDLCREIALLIDKELGLSADIGKC